MNQSHPPFMLNTFMRSRVTQTALGLTALGCFSFLGSAASATEPTPPPPVTPSTITVSGFAAPAEAMTGSCLSFNLKVSGTQDGVASLPIISTLHGPWSEPPKIGDTASGSTVGKITATWDGTEWQYSSECIPVTTAGTYVWTLNNTNSETGLDDTVHATSLVTVTTPPPPPTQEPTPKTNDATTPGSTDVDPAATEGATPPRTKPQLAKTGNSDLASLVTAGTLALLGGAGVVGWARLRNKKKLPFANAL